MLKADVPYRDKLFEVTEEVWVLFEEFLQLCVCGLGIVDECLEDFYFVLDAAQVAVYRKVLALRTGRSAARCRRTLRGVLGVQCWTDPIASELRYCPQSQPSSFSPSFSGKISLTCPLKIRRPILRNFGITFFATILLRPSAFVGSASGSGTSHKAAWIKIR